MDNRSNHTYPRRPFQIGKVKILENLLDIWWFHASPEIIDGYGFQQEFYFLLLNLWGKFERIKTFKDYEDFMLNRAYGRAHIYALLELFGMIKTEMRPPRQGTGWDVKTISPTKFGVQLISQLNKLLVINLFDKTNNLDNDVEKKFILQIKEQYPSGYIIFNHKKKSDFAMLHM